MPNPSVEDIAALRSSGDDFREYLRSLTGAKPNLEPAQTATEPANYGPLHRRGAWPVGTRSDATVTCDPGCECALNNPPTMGGKA